MVMYSKMSENRLNLVALPTEIKQIIFNHLDQDTAEMIRNVSMNLKHDIDEYYHWTTCLYQSDANLEWLMKRRIRDCTVGVLVMPLPGQGFPEFAFPKLIKRLAIISSPPERGMEEDDNIGSYSHPDVITKLVASVQNNVTDLTITLDNKGWCKEYEKLSFSFPVLKTLNIRLELTAQVFDKGLVQSGTIFFAITEKCNIPLLNVLRMKIDIKLGKLSTGRTLLANIMSIAQNKILKGIDIEFGDFVSESNVDMLVDDLDIKNQNILQRMTSLSELRLSKVNYLEGGSWENLVVIQSNLDKIDLSYLNKNLKIPFISSLVERNMNLVSITLNNVEGIHYNANGRQILDFQIFESLSNLKELVLGCQTNCYYFCPDFAHIHLIPSTIEILILKNFKIETDSLLAIPTHGLKLAKMELLYSGYELAYGVDAEVLRHIMSVESLQYLYIKQYKFVDEEHQLDLYDFCMCENITLDGTFPNCFIKIERSSSVSNWTDIIKL